MGYIRLISIKSLTFILHKKKAAVQTRSKVCAADRWDINPNGLSCAPLAEVK